MSRSPYVDSVVLTNKHSGKRTHKVQAFVIHHMAAKWTGKRCAEYFRDTPSKQASANYCIGYNGDVALNVVEHNRAWTSSSAWADQRAITYELANSKSGHPWEVSEDTLNKAISMLAEHHKRYGLKEASYTGDTKGTLWRHDWFAGTNCPGPYLADKLPYMADEINKILRGDKKTSEPKKKPVEVSTRKSNEQVAQEVYNGLWGNGPQRKQKLEQSGYNYNTIQGIVNKLAGGSNKPVKSIDTLAKEVIDGKHGTGSVRREVLGSRYNEVQKRVNEILGAKTTPKKSVDTLAKEVIDGKYGSGEARKKALGSQYKAVQNRVNQLLGGSNQKSVKQLADEVERGLHGTGEARKKSLGSRYNEVQAEINRRYR